jgi:hypothetical protein
VGFGGFVGEQKSAAERRLSNVGHFEGFDIIRWIGRPRGRRTFPHELAVSFRVRCDRSVSRLWVARSRFAVPGRAGHAVFPTGRRVRMGLISANAPLVEFRRPSGSCTDDASSKSLDRSAFSGLSAPMTHPADEVWFTRALPARHLPSSGFGHPLDGFLPRRPCRPCFMPAAPMGFSLRSVLLA